MNVSVFTSFSLSLSLCSLTISLLHSTACYSIFVQHYIRVFSVEILLNDNTSKIVYTPVLHSRKMLITLLGNIEGGKTMSGVWNSFKTMATFCPHCIAPNITLFDKEFYLFENNTKNQVVYESTANK